MAQKVTNEGKIIRDSIHGNIEIKGLFLELMELPELQRLHNIRQLGFTYLVYPGANHTRLEHSLGTCYVAQRMAETLDIKSPVFIAAALLHDIGHGPFSHTLEYIVHERTGKSHVELTGEIITGKKRIVDFEGGSIKEVLGTYGIDAGEVASILYGKKGHLSEMIHGSIDADQIDYLMRDAYYTGVAYGVIDAQRLLQTIKIHEGHVVVEKKGLSALESMLVARSLMYSSVYLHKTVRIAELMLVRAVEHAPSFDFLYMTDGELMECLKHMGGFQEDMMRRLKYRRLFKRAHTKNFSELSPHEKERIAEMEDVGEVERHIAEGAGIDEGYVIVDVPGRDILISEPRLHKIDVNIFDGDVKPLGEYTPLANALQMRGITEWALMVCCPEKAREKVAKVAEKVLWA